MDTYQNQLSELEELRKEFVSLDTDEQRAEFDSKMKRIISSKNKEEAVLFQQAFIEGAKDACKEAEATIEYVNLRLRLEKIYSLVSWSYIAKEYFGKSRAWLNQRINGFIVNGKGAEFTTEEKKILSDALFDISKKIHDTARSF